MFSPLLHFTGYQKCPSVSCAKKISAQEQAVILSKDWARTSTAANTETPFNWPIHYAPLDRVCNPNTAFKSTSIPRYHSTGCFPLVCFTGYQKCPSVSCAKKICAQEQSVILSKGWIRTSTATYTETPLNWPIHYAPLDRVCNSNWKILSEGSPGSRL